MQYLKHVFILVLALGAGFGSYIVYHSHELMKSNEITKQQYLQQEAHPQKMWETYKRRRDELKRRKL
jgi:hypothetical protein